MIKNKFCYLLLLVSISYANSWKISKAQPIVDKSIYELYNYNLDYSLELLDSAYNIDPNHPIIPFLTTSTLWLQSQMLFGYEQSYNQIEESLNISIPLYDQLIKENPDNFEYHLYLGALYGLKSRVALANNEWIKVFFSSIKGYNLIDNVFENNQSLLDALTPIGIISYYSSISNPFIKTSAKILGIYPDSKYGIELLEVASEESYYSWIESSNILTYIYLYMERDYKKALDKINPLVKKFPNHPFFIFLKAESLVKLQQWNDYDDIRPLLLKLSEHKSTIIANECKLKLKYLDALYAFNHNDIDYSIILCTEIIDLYDMEFNWLLGLSYMQRALSYIAIKDIENARYDLQLISNMDSKYPEIKESQELLHLLSNAR